MRFPSWARLPRGSLLTGLTLLAFAILNALTSPSPAAADSPDGCRPEPITANTPTGVAGCRRFGDGIASHYREGDTGVAMNFCTWTLRHTSGCGEVTIYAYATRRSVTVPVIDFCDCYTGTDDERIVDLEFGIVRRLGLGLDDGLYRVRVSAPSVSSSLRTGCSRAPSSPSGRSGCRVGRGRCQTGLATRRPPLPRPWPQAAALAVRYGR